MCRNIKTIYNFDPPASPEEIREASLQFVRKLSGMRVPSEVNKNAFEAAISTISKDISSLLKSLKTEAKPKSREEEAKKARERNAKRFAAK